jgi:uncharacterized protein YecT (DUF1311 family)
VTARISVVTGLVLFWFSQIAFAGDVGLSKQFSTCMDKSGGITAEMLNCIGAETKRQDARLNKAYKEVMAHLSPERKKQLLAAQRAWITFRDANSSFYADPEGGTMATVNASDNFMSATASRAMELEGFK